MKIIEVISDTNIGGAGILLVNRLSCTNLKKYQTTVLLPSRGQLKSRLEKIGVRCIEVDCEGDKSFDLAAVKKYAEIFRRERPDIINTHGTLSARIAAKLCAVPVKICTRHCVFPLNENEKRFGKISSMLSDCYIAVAHSAKQNLIDMGVNPKKIKVIINGARALRSISENEKTALREKLGIGEHTCVLCFCARLERCKGHEWFLKCASLLSSQSFDFKVLILGEGSQREHLGRLCREYEIEDKVVFCGFCEDTAPYMSISHININCSIGTETSSLALSEGMSIGLPAVASRYGGNPYMIRQGINGFLCPCGDFRCMAMYIKRLCQDKKLYNRMSQAARERYTSELNAEAMTEKTNRLYDELYRRRADI